MRAYSVLAPASSANLGPGFDSLAIALDLWMRVDVTPTAGSGILDVGTPDLLGGDNLVATAMRVTAVRLGVELPGCEIHVSSDIPVARGLGSSAAAIAAGIRAAGALSGVEIDDALAVDIGGRMEGHADNASAAILGGVTVAMAVGDGFVAEVLERDLPWQPVVFVPTRPSFTHEARGVLPVAIPIHDAASNIGRAVFLAYALRARRADLLREAMTDRLHQPYRAHIFPHLEPAIAAALDAGAAGACLSGAGPTILALAEPALEDAVGAAMAAAGEAHGVPGSSLSLRLPARGCHVVTGRVVTRDA